MWPIFRIVIFADSGYAGQKMALVLWHTPDLKRELGIVRMQGKAYFLRADPRAPLREKSRWVKLPRGTCLGNKAGVLWPR